MIYLERIDFSKYKRILESKDFIRYSGKVSQVVGLTVESIGPAVNLNELCQIYNLKDNSPVLAEVVGFKDNIVSLMPLGSLEGIGPGSPVVATGKKMYVPIGYGLLGRVLDGLGRPMDGFGQLEESVLYPIYNEPPDPLTRKVIKTPLPIGT